MAARFEVKVEVETETKTKPVIREYTTFLKRKGASAGLLSPAGRRVTHTHGMA